MSELEKAEGCEGAQIIILDIPTTQPIPPDRILQAAVGKLEDVLLIGRTPDGEVYIAGSLANRAENNMLADELKLAILQLERAQ